MAGKSAGHGVPSIPSSFWEGATRPSWPALVLTLAISAAALWACRTWITEDFFLRHANHFRVCRDDTRLDATVQAIELSRGHTAGPLLVAIGDARAIDERWTTKLPHAIAVRGSRIRFVNLTSEGQTLWESAALLDRLPRGSSGVVLLDATPPRFDVSPKWIDVLAKRPPFGFRSRAFDSELWLSGNRAQSRYDKFFLDNQSFLIPRAPAVVRNLLFGVQASCPKDRPKEERTDEAFATNAAVLDRLVGRLIRQTRLDCLLIDGTAGKEVEAIWKPAERAASLRKLAESNRVDRASGIDPGDPKEVEPLADWIVQRLKHANR